MSLNGECIKRVGQVEREADTRSACIIEKRKQMEKIESSRIEKNMSKTRFTFFCAAIAMLEANPCRSGLFFFSLLSLLREHLSAHVFVQNKFLFAIFNT